MRLNHRWVFLQAIVELSKCRIHVIGKPFGFSKEKLSIGEPTVLLGYILKELYSLNKVLGSSLAGWDGLAATMHEILLSQFHEEVGIKFDVELEISRGLLRRSDMQV